MPVAPDPEVVEQARRRRFTAKYKLGVLAAADRCEPGQLGALLRRKGLYSSHLTCWRRQREAGALAGLAARQRGRPAPVPDVQGQRVVELERENAQLRQRLLQAETIIDVQKKSCLLGDRPEPASVRRAALMTTAATLGAQVGMVRACRSLGVARATLYRQRARDTHRPSRPPCGRPRPEADPRGT